MPLTSSAKKALRQDKRRNLVNRRVRNIMKLAVRAVRENPVSDNLSKAFQAIDRSAKKNLLHQNKAARMKSQLTKLVTANSSK